MDWFRMYSDMPNDPKVGTLTDSQFRTWVELLCMAGKEGNCGSIGVTLRDASWSLRRDITDDVNELVERGLVIMDGCKVVIAKWSKRQFKSDHDAADRMKRSREKGRYVTVTSQDRNCVIPDTDNNRTETEQIQSREDKPLSREKLNFDEVRDIYRHVFRDMLPSPHICQQLEWVADNFAAEEIRDAFTAADSKKATSFVYITKRLKNIESSRKTDDAFWSGLEGGE